MYCSVDPFSVFMYMFGIDSGAAELQNTFRTTPVGKWGACNCFAKLIFYLDLFCPSAVL